MTHYFLTFTGDSQKHSANPSYFVMAEQVIIVPTAQNIELIYPIASVGDRIKAYLIDLTCMTGYVLFFYTLLEVGSNDVLGILFAIPLVTYSLICELVLGDQSIGKKLLNLKVIRVNGKRPGFSGILLRWLARVIDTNPILFLGLPALIAVGASKKGQRLGDMLAGTTVIRLKLSTSFDDTMFMFTDDAYEVRFPEIRNLKDKDVAILKEVLDVALRSNNVDLMRKLAARVKDVLEVTSPLPNDLFLETVLKDYNHIYGRSAAAPAKNGSRI